MPDELRQMIERLEQDFKAMGDRLNDLERDHLKIRQRVPVPFRMPTRTVTQVALAVSGILMVIALGLVISPQTITVGGVLYNWPGVSAESIATAGAILSLGVGAREYLKDKSDFKDKGD